MASMLSDKGNLSFPGKITKSLSRFKTSRDVIIDLESAGASFFFPWQGAYFMKFVRQGFNFHNIANVSPYQEVFA